MGKNITHVVWTKQCACDFYMPDEYDLCDVCMLNKYNLHAKFDALDHLGYYPLYNEDVVLDAIRKAEKK